jgi:hypothetical protein
MEAGLLDNAYIISELPGTVFNCLAINSSIKQLQRFKSSVFLQNRGMS